MTDGGTDTYTTNNLNQYTTGDGVSFTYDENGNLTYDGTNTYYYDSENQLTKAATTSNTYYYEYNPFGKRIEKRGGGTTTKYIYEGDRVIEERDGNNDLIARYIYGSGLDEVLTMERDDNTYYYHYDRLGSVVTLSDENGDSVESYYYDVFGGADTYGSTGNPYFFIARRRDTETELIYCRARMYAIKPGRFIQPDPLRYTDGLNLYCYVHNSPINHIDNLGTIKDCLVGAVDPPPKLLKDAHAYVICDSSGNISCQWAWDYPKGLFYDVKQCIIDHENWHIEEFKKHKEIVCYCLENKGSTYPIPPDQWDKWGKLHECENLHLTLGCFERARKKNQCPEGDASWISIGSVCKQIAEKKRYTKRKLQLLNCP